MPSSHCRRTNLARLLAGSHEQGPRVRSRSLGPRPPAAAACAPRPWKAVARPFGSAILGEPGPAERDSKQPPEALSGLPQAPGPLAGVKASTPPAKVGASVSCPGQPGTGGARAATGGRSAWASPPSRLRKRHGSSITVTPPPRGPPVGPSPPHLPVLGFLLQGSLVQPVHRVRGRGWEVAAAQAAPLLHLGAVVRGAVVHAWEGGEGFRLEV